MWAHEHWGLNIHEGKHIYICIIHSLVYLYDVYYKNLIKLFCYIDEGEAPDIVTFSKRTQIAGYFLKQGIYINHHNLYRYHSYHN